MPSRSKKSRSRGSRRSRRKIRVRGGVYAPLTTALAGTAVGAAVGENAEGAAMGATAGYVGGSALQDLDRTIKGQKIVYTDKEGNEVQESKLLSYAPEVLAALAAAHGSRKLKEETDDKKGEALAIQGLGAYTLSSAARDAYRWYKGAEVRDKGPKSRSPPAANVEEEEASSPTPHHHHALTPHHPLTPRASRRSKPARRSKRRSGSRK